jgi:antirestriction protein ArdC
MSNKVYEIVTENIVKMLDEGVVPWRQPWHNRGSNIATNAWDKPYRGINVFILGFTRFARGYKSNTWMTFKQVAERGGRVREGEKSTLVVFWKPLKVEDKTAKAGFKTVPLLRYFSVFNLDQTHDVKLTKKQQGWLNPVEATEFDPWDDAEAIIGTYLSSDSAPTFIERGNQPAYSPLLDEVYIPERSQFPEMAGFYPTVFHEFTHSTGHASRLARKENGQVNHFGDDKYAFEELVAEFGASFLSAEASVDNTLENSAAYIQHWSARFKDDPTLIVKAASAAQKAVDYILGTTFEKEAE